MIRVEIVYTDGGVVEIHPRHWQALRADGVDEVRVTNSQGTVTFGGHSVYWCRDTEAGWAVGAASFYQNNRPPEVVFTDHSQKSVPLAPHYVPDLKHGEIKLGAWRNGCAGDLFEGG